MRPEMSAATRRWIGWTGVSAVGVYLAYDGYDEVLADLSTSLHLWRNQSLRFWMVILFPWAFAAGSVMVCSVCLTVLSFRRRVFVSFHHSQERVAEDLSSALSRAGLKVSRIPFDPDHQHDRLLKEQLDPMPRDGPEARAERGRVEGPIGHGARRLTRAAANGPVGWRSGGASWRA